MRRGRLYGLSAAGVGLAALIIVLVWQARTALDRGRQVERVSAENTRLRTQLDTLNRQLAAAHAQPAPEPSGPAPVEAGNGKFKQMEKMLAEQAQTVERLQTSLTEANASVSKLEGRVQDLQVQNQKLAADNNRFSASESDLKDNLASANRLVAALQKELKDKTGHLVQVEIANQKLQDQSREDTRRIEQFATLSSELQEIHRRGETYLNSILRRYREVTDQYRALSGMLENRRADPSEVNSADLSRIQNSISMAEEDLRQLSALNAQAVRIQKKIAGK